MMVSGSTSFFYFSLAFPQFSPGQAFYLYILFSSARMSGASDLKSDRTRGVTKSILENDLLKPQGYAGSCCPFSPI